MTIQETHLFHQLPCPLPDGYREEDVLFLNLETQAFGRADRPILYLGIIRHTANGWQVRQWLPDKGEEASMLQDFLSFLGSSTCLVHYNGSSFDIPILEKRLKRFQLSSPLKEKRQLDLYRLFAPLKKLLGLPHLSQACLEQYLGIGRTGNDNDLTCLPLLLPLLSYLDFLNGNFSISSAEIKEEDPVKGHLIVHGQCRRPFPKAFSHHYPFAYVSGEKNQFSMSVEGRFGTMKYFFKNYKDYYYLPLEDMAVHKSVASYVEKEYRQPAKASNCYVKKNGFFLIQKEPFSQPVFAQEYNTKPYFLLCDKQMMDNQALMDTYLKNVLNDL